MTTLAFSFTKLVVADLDVVERFYREALGLTPLRRSLLDEAAIPQEQSALAVGGADGHILVLARYLEQPPPPPGEAWTGFVVADLAAATAAVERCGGRIVVPIHEAPAQGVRAVIVTDPEGHLIELIQMLAAARETPSRAGA